ncbi:MAG: DUF1761 domain-containing protein [Bacteroidetes bacterium]|nr:MAG: DUF1761 domain-containing protein [Bacteroidota bacterium]
MKTNYLAILACGIVNALLGMGWFGMFAQQWMDGHGITRDMVENMDNPGMAYGLSFAVALITAWLITTLMQRMDVKDWMDGAKIGLTIGLFGFLGSIVANLFALKPFDLSLVDGGFVLLQFALFGAILGGWQKR